MFVYIYIFILCMLAKLKQGMANACKGHRTEFGQTHRRVT